jgi:hypothetical protein
MNNYRWLFPLVASATVIGIRWYRTNDGNTMIYHIKKKYWYACIEAAITVAAIVLAFNING